MTAEGWKLKNTGLESDAHKTERCGCNGVIICCCVAEKQNNAPFVVVEMYGHPDKTIERGWEKCIVFIDAFSGPLIPLLILRSFNFSFNTVQC